MATETVTAGSAPAIPARTETPPATWLIEDRRSVGLEAAWELDALRETVNDLCSDLGHPDLTQPHLMALRLKIRGLTMRMGQLASVVMSVLEDDDDETNALYRKVHGCAPAVEVAHG